MSELKPCPFCGGEAKLCKTTKEVWVECKCCHCGTAIASGASTMETKIEVVVHDWNRRAEDGTGIVEFRLGKSPTGCHCQSHRKENTMTLKMCDRCGKRIETKKPILRPNGKACDVWLGSELELFGRTGRRYDLCFECANDLNAFLQGRITAITDQTMDAIKKIGEKAHGVNDDGK